MEVVDPVGDQEDRLTLRGEGGVAAPGADQRGDRAELVVHRLREDGDVELGVAQDHRDAHRLGSDGAEVAGVLEEAGDGADGGQWQRGEFADLFQGGPTGEQIIAALDPQAEAGIVGQHDLEARQEDVEQVVVQSAELRPVGEAQQHAVGDVAVEDELPRRAAFVARDDLGGPGRERKGFRHPGDDTGAISDCRGVRRRHSWNR